MKFQISDFRFKILVVLGIIFFFIYSFLIFGNSLSKFTWPDETANYFFIKNYAEKGSFSVAEPLNAIADNLVKPRSFNIYNGNLVPGSFLGLLLIYGLIAKILGMGLIKFLTPFLAVLAVLFFYKILLKIFEPQVAFLSSLFFFILPAWWYYASFTMLPNISFLAFLLIGFYFLLSLDKEKKRKSILFLIAGSFFIALALTIRTNEFVWVLAILLLLLLVYSQRVKWWYLPIFLTVCGLIFLPIFYYNQITYGSYLSFGYLRLDQGNDWLSQLPTEFKTSANPAFNFFKFIFLPFGFHPKTALNNFYNYFIKLFWWFFLAAALGVFSYIKRYQEKKQAVFLMIFLLVSLYLFVYYGSWVFNDVLTLQLNKIGLSYVRYFLPIFIFCLPLVVIFYLQLINLFSQKKFKIFCSLLLFIIFSGFSLNAVCLAANDGLLNIKQNITDYNQINQQVTRLTEANAVIISQRSDKIFFPERKVIVYNNNPEEMDGWFNLIQAGIPLYYYAYEGDNYLNQLYYDLAVYDLSLAELEVITPTESLIKVIYAPFYE